MAHPELAKAIEVAGLRPLAGALGVTYQALRKWEAKGRLPRTEWTGETDYARRIVAVVGDVVSVEGLLQMHGDANRKEAA